MNRQPRRTGQRGMLTLWGRSMARRDHAFARRRMSQYIDGELDLRRAARVARHADDCPECGPLLRSLRRLVAELHELDDPTWPRMAPRVLERLHADDERAPRP